MDKAQQINAHSSIPLDAATSLPNAMRSLTVQRSAYLFCWFENLRNGKAGSQKNEINLEIFSSPSFLTYMQVFMDKIYLSLFPSIIT